VNKDFSEGLFFERLGSMDLSRDITIELVGVDGESSWYDPIKSVEFKDGAIYVNNGHYTYVEQLFKLNGILLYYTGVNSES